MRPLRIVEHTAQLSRDESYEYQKRFKNKEIDILSCSTTFEMGVDVGTLETVFMRNMPPSPSNYAQRAGRAGRSIESAAFALTFCNKSNHDFTFFNDPVSMIKGKILPPAFNVNNEKIAIRHIYASAVSFFWKKNPEFFSTAKK
ncbi:MAG: helicase C-terminal domain-containing protein [Anaerovoracaceae bacterium]